MTAGAKIINKILANLNLAALKGSLVMIQWNLSLGCTAGSTYPNQSMWFITLLKWKRRITQARQPAGREHSL